MFRHGHSFVPLQVGAITPTVLLIQGEAPGAEEAESGIPFVGAAGKVLRYHILKLAGVNPQSVAYDNTLRCQPPNNEYPTGERRRSAESHCRQYDRWREFPPHIPLLCVGGKAARMYLGDERITEWHGHITQVDGRVVGFTLHPSYVNRNFSLLPVVVREVANLLRAAANPTLLARPAVYKTRFLPLRALPMAVDLEWNPAGKISAVGIAYEPDAGYSTFDVGLAVEQVREHIRAGRLVIGHNLIEADLPKLDIAPRSWSPTHVFDTRVAAHLVHAHLAGAGFYDLGGLVRFYDPTPNWKQDTSDLLQYNGLDVAYTYRLYLHLRRDLVQTAQTHLLEHDQALTHLCYRMGQAGLRVDVALLERLATEEHEQRDAIRSQLPINPNSPTQIVRWARSLGIPLENAELETLERYRGRNELFDLLVRYREGAKSLRTWFPYEMDKAGRFLSAPERIYPQFSAVGTAVARLASSGPNVQNIPPHLRALILPDEDDHELVFFDAKQIENRTVSWLAGDRAALEAWSTYDPYRYVAALIFGVRYEEVTDEQRRIGKITELATLYGETEYNLAQRLFGNRTRASVARAKKLQEAYFAARPRIAEWQRRVREQVSSGNVQFRNPYGRVRFVYERNEHELTKRACHFLGCSTAADTVNRRAVWVWRELGLIPKLIVHDEIVWSIPRGEDKLIERIWEILHAPVTEMNGLVLPWEGWRGSRYSKQDSVKIELRGA